MSKKTPSCSIAYRCIGSHAFPHDLSAPGSRLLLRLRGTRQALRRIWQGRQAPQRNWLLTSSTDPVDALCHTGERRADSHHLPEHRLRKFISDGVILQHGHLFLQVRVQWIDGALAIGLKLGETALELNKAGCQVLA